MAVPRRQSTGMEDEELTTASLPGQKLSACTCKGEDHPGPDVSYGRGAPEIDVLEAQVGMDTAGVMRGEVSQSAQLAPFDANYYSANTSRDVIQYDTSRTHWNSYRGGVYQQASSSVTYTNPVNYQLQSGTFGSYGE